MSERRIEALKFGKERIYVEVIEVEQGELDAYEETSVQSKVIATGEQIRKTISALATTVHKALDKAAPEEWTLEIALGFKSKAGIPFITAGEANGAVKVTAKWKRSSAHEQ